MDIFSKIQTSVVKVLDPSLLKLNRESLVALFKDNWPDLPQESKEDICTKVGINKLNIEKNIHAFDLFQLDSAKDSKLQKLAYLAKMHAKLIKYRQ